MYRLAYAYWRLDEHQECKDTCEKVFKMAKTNPELDINGYVNHCRSLHYFALGEINAVTLKSELGAFALNDEFNCFERHIPLDGRSVSVSVDVMVEDASTWQADMDIAVTFCKELFDTLPKVKEYAADNLLDLANSWCKDDEKITKDVFISRLQLTTIAFCDGEEYTLYFNNEEMFTDHAVAIYGNANSGFERAGIRQITRNYKGDITMNINPSKTSEKFLPMVDIIIPSLIETLTAICDLEEKYGVLIDEKGDMFHEELWHEYKEQYRAIVEPVCTEELLKRGYALSLKSPSTYAYIKTTDYNIGFTMKSDKKSIVEMCNVDETMARHQLTLIYTENGYKIHAIKYRHGEGTTWTNYYI